MLHLVFKNAFTWPFLPSPSLEGSMGDISSSPSCFSAQNWAQRRFTINSRINSSSSDLHHFPLGLCQTKRDPISTRVIVEPHSTLPCILPSQEGHLFFYLLRTVVRCLCTPTGTQVSWSHYGTLINIHPGHPRGCPLYPQRCLDFHEYQHEGSRLKICAESTGRAQSSEVGPRAKGLRRTSGMLWLMPLTSQFDRRSYEKAN